MALTGHQVKLQLDPETYRALVKRATENHRTIHEELQLALRRYLR